MKDAFAHACAWAIGQAGRKSILHTSINTCIQDTYTPDYRRALVSAFRPRVLASKGVLHTTLILAFTYNNQY